MMMDFKIGDVVVLKNNPSKKNKIVSYTIEETGRLIYKVENEGYYYPEDIKALTTETTSVDTQNNIQKTVIVTGGAGYAGSLLLRRLLQEQYKVVCIDNLRFGGNALIDIWDHPSFTFYRADVTDHVNIKKIIEATPELYGIVHLAAIVGDPACKLEPELANRINYNSAINLIETAVTLNIERFIFASTCSNYGKMTKADGYVDEGSPLAPVSLYAELKVKMERYILNEIEKSDMFCPTCLRFATLYGLSPRMRFDLTVNEFTKDIALGKELDIYGEQFWRPYCHVKDFSQAIIKVLRAQKSKVAYNVFNVGETGENYTKKMIAEELLKLSPEAKINYVKRDEDPRDYRVNFTKIKNELGFAISKTVPEGINEVYNSIMLNIIDDPDNKRYYNTPVV